MRISLFISLFCFFNSAFLQKFSESEIKNLANRVNSELEGVDVGNGIYLRKCLAVNRTLYYQYDVPDNWFPVNNMKEDIIRNYTNAGYAKTYFENDIDVDFLYFKGNKLEKKVSIKSDEFGSKPNSIALPFENFSLGEYLSIQGHPKAKEVNLKLKRPIGWEIEEGNRPNIVKKFVKDGDSYLIMVKDNYMFVSRNEARDLFSDEELTTELIEGYDDFFENPELLTKKTVTIDNYPALEFTIKGEKEQLDNKFNMILKIWFILFEDKIVILQSSGLGERNFHKLEPLYDQITSSVIFPDQYD